MRIERLYRVGGVGDDLEVVVVPSDHLVEGKAGQETVERGLKFLGILRVRECVSMKSGIILREIKQKRKSDRRE